MKKAGGPQAFDMFPRSSYVKTSAILSKHDVCKHIEIKTDMDEFD